MILPAAPARRTLGRRRLATVILAASIAAPAASSSAQTRTAPGVATISPVGLWRQVDDKTGEARSLIRIFEDQGKLYGRVERMLDPADANRTCRDCPGDMRGQPVLGLVFMRGLVRDGDGWSGGTIVDPASGSTYKCSLRVADPAGRKLEVRGYLGVSLLGRTQTWLREG